MKVVIGLGNIGSKYTDTHHNIGFLMADIFAEKAGLIFSKKKFDAFIAEGIINGEKIIVMKPTTFMNLSGKSVLAVSKKLKVSSKNILIVYDDIDLPVGKVRFRRNGSGGTHNGMRNIIEVMGTEDIPRVRIGIGTPERGMLTRYVLEKISKENMEKINAAKAEVLETIYRFIEGK